MLQPYIMALISTVMIYILSKGGAYTLWVLVHSPRQYYNYDAAPVLRRSRTYFDCAGVGPTSSQVCVHHS